ncbi:hypothetical protein HHX47_DHR7000713 [Lentinula edodes]|nr:hypothetical protein HHX47_DHR7000713 [Lentinula edodes]
MLIPVTFDRHPSTSSLQKLPPSLLKISHDEVVLLDLQGALEVDSSHPNERDGKFIGTLTIDDDMKRSTLRIGHHLIEGKLVNLPKPLAVLHRSPAPVRISDSRWTGEDGGGDEDVVMDDPRLPPQYNGTHWRSLNVKFYLRNDQRHSQED